MPDPPNCSISEAAALLGVSAHTLRYYDREGLLDVPRASGRGRRYGEHELAYLKFLIYLRGTGMGMAGLRAYAALARQGEATVAQRRDLLVRHEAQVAAQLEGMHRALDAIRAKIARYDALPRNAATRPGLSAGSPADLPSSPTDIQHLTPRSSI